MLDFLKLWSRATLSPEGAGAGAGEGGGEGGGAGAAAGQGQGQGSGEGGGQGAGQGDGGGSGQGNGEGGFHQNGGEVPYSTLQSQLPEDLREAAGRYNSFQDVIRSNMTLRNEISDRIRVPSERSSDEDMAKFRKSMGVPDSPEGYQIEPPQGEEFDEGDKVVIDAFRPIAHKYNIPQKAFADFLRELSAESDKMRERLAAEISSSQQEAQAALDKEWGADKDKNYALSARAAEAHGGEAFLNFIDTTKLDGGGILGDHPLMVRFLATIGAKTDEHDVMLQSSESEREDAKTQLQNIMDEHFGKPSYTSEKVQKDIRRLNEILAGGAGQPIVGTAGRQN